MISSTLHTRSLLLASLVAAQMSLSAIAADLQAGGAVVAAEPTTVVSMMSERLANTKQRLFGGSNLNGASDAGVVKPTDQTVDQYKKLSARIEKYLESSEPLVRYQAFKAKSWLGYAQHQTYEGGLTKAYTESFAEADRIVTLLEQGQQPTLTTPIISVSGVMRRDLWAVAEILKQHPSFTEGIAPKVAEAEVKLVWAAAEYCELGWRHSREHFSDAERLLYAAKSTAVLASNAPAWPENIQLPSLVELNGSEPGCHGVKGSWPIPVPAFAVAPVTCLPSDPVPAPVRSPVIVPPPVAPDSPAVVEIPSNVHFALDKSFLSAESKQVLDGIVKLLKQYPKVTISLTGFTDSRASAAYNAALSARRVDTVYQYMLNKGIAADRMAKFAKGMNDLRSDADAVRGHALSRRVEMKYFIESMEIPTREQQADLQLERHGESKARPQAAKPKVKKN